MKRERVDIIEAARRALGGDYAESPVHVAEWVCRAKMAEDENKILRWLLAEKEKDR